VLSIGQTVLPEKVKLRYATLDSSRHFGEPRDGGRGRSLAVRPIRPANLGGSIRTTIPMWQVSSLESGDAGRIPKLQRDRRGQERQGGRSC